jgi:hypothetical protein
MQMYIYIYIRIFVVIYIVVCVSFSAPLLGKVLGGAVIVLVADGWLLLAGCVSKRILYSQSQSISIILLIYACHFRIVLGVSSHRKLQHNVSFYR